MSRRVPSLRIRSLNSREVRSDGEFVVYWMIAYRRRHYNFALQRAAVLAEALDKPLIVFEGLRTGYRWASDRIHSFVIQGIADNRARFDGSCSFYYPWIEQSENAGHGLLESLGERACAVVTDDYPAFFLPKMVRAAGARLPVRLEAVDSNGLLPLRAADRTFARAHDFRRFLHRTLPAHLDAEALPRPDPLEDLRLPALSDLPASIRRQWPMVDPVAFVEEQSWRTLPIDHGVAPSKLRGGASPAEHRWSQFMDRGLRLYADGRNHPDDDLSSGLSPWLHFGHISPHQIFADMVGASGWDLSRLSKPTGKREGWWGMPPGFEAFLDELVTWRELGFNMAHRDEKYTEFDSLPPWALETLEAHENDPRPFTYSLEQFESASTHDELWNAAQRQLVSEGRIHNYLRMLWGKKILHWAESPRAALAVMEELNNKYALDGRDPNSYSGIFWVLGRYDRPWGPERDIFGKIRYMTSDSTQKKLRVQRYLSRWAG